MFERYHFQCKGVVEVARLAYVKTRKSPSRDLAFVNVDNWLRVLSTKANVLRLLYVVVLRCCLLYLIRQSWFVKF